MTRLYRPLVQADARRPPGALAVAGGSCWFASAEEIAPAGRRIVPAAAIPSAERACITAARPALAGLPLDRPRIMGVLNATSDSFSDGGRFETLADAIARGRAIAEEGADILDIGGESTRPGAVPVATETEIRRTAPVIEALRADGVRLPISIDTRKAAVARAAIDAGADMVNDVSALRFDAGLAPLVAEAGVPVVLMHAQGRPETMQKAPAYDDVLRDVYDFLAERVAAAEAAGIARARLLVDPGIGFGKTVAHNLALLRGMSLFHGLGLPILLGASRKRFIGTLGSGNAGPERMPGSVAVALGAVAQGVQILRVHDIAATRQALRLSGAVFGDQQ